MGKKLGAVLGVAAYMVSGLANKSQIQKILSTSPNKAVTIAIAVTIGAFGGYTLGAIADKLSNNKAAKAVDRAALA